MLQVEGLVCRYGRVTAVRELSIEVRAGELVTLIGALRDGPRNKTAAAQKSGAAVLLKRSRVHRNR